MSGRPFFPLRFGVVVLVAALGFSGCQQQTEPTTKKQPARTVKIDLETPADTSVPPRDRPKNLPSDDSSPTSVARQSVSDDGSTATRATEQMLRDRPSALRPSVRPTDPAPIEVPASGSVGTKVDHPAAIPTVVLTAPMKADCLVFVGDAMPRGQLHDAAGKTVEWETLRGLRATVLLMVSADAGSDIRSQTIAALEDLTAEVAIPWGGQGVAVIGICVGGSSEVLAALQPRAKFPLLYDSHREFFSLVAKQRLPRVYLLDAAGKIVWFDLEFSRTTRRDLIRALTALVGPHS